MTPTDAITYFLTGTAITIIMTFLMAGFGAYVFFTGYYPEIRCPSCGHKH